MWGRSVPKVGDIGDSDHTFLLLLTDPRKKVRSTRDIFPGSFRFFPCVLRNKEELLHFP